MTPRPGPALLGRRAERAALDALVTGVRAGRSQVLVLRGEAGVGKTALLEDLLERVAGCRILRVAGVESEMELAFAGLHQLCAPLLDRLDRLPEAQRAALGAAFGMTTEAVADRFLVGVAVLGLLTDAARERPLICLVDDVQWLDRFSALTLAFVARRLSAQRVGVVFAVREPAADQHLADLPHLVLEGLGDGDARTLLDAAIPGALDARVRDRIIAETRGNPLALLELPRGLPLAELAGGFRLPDPTTLAGRIEDGFARRLDALPTATRRLMLTAAADPVGDATLLWRAAERLGIGADAAAGAEATGLIELGARVRFRHPLVRSAAYRSASALERRQAHGALAEATDAQLDPDRRAWHRAHAAAAPDEAVAAELEQSAGRAYARGGAAAAAAFLERAAELTPDPAQRGVRALAAAGAKLDAGAPDAALELLAAAELSPLDALQRGRLERLRAQLAFVGHRGSEALPALLAAAQRLEKLDLVLARDTYLDALGAAVFAERLDGAHATRQVAEAARAVPRAPGRQRSIDLLLDGLAIRLTDGFAASVAPLQRALRAFARTPERDPRWLWLGWPVAIELWDDHACRTLTRWAVASARASGDLSLLPVALSDRAGAHLGAGDLVAAAALIHEAEAVNDATGVMPLTYAAPVLAALRGQDRRGAEVLDPGLEAAMARGEGRAMTVLHYSRSVLLNSQGRYDDAFTEAQRACDREDLGLIGWALAELVEAAARSGRPDVAATALTRLEARTQAAGTDWALGVLAVSRGLLSQCEDAEALHREALARLSTGKVLAVRHARVQLIYGEWLRREGRRTDAREQLRAAHRRFDDMGADGFAERARRELAATGETARRRTAETRDDLTAQEAEIARLAADGLSNPEIAARLFISPRTVEWHMKKVFGKLGIRSRKELRRTWPDAPDDLAASA